MVSPKKHSSVYLGGREKWERGGGRREGEKGKGSGGRGRGKVEGEGLLLHIKKSKSTYKQTKIKNTKKAWLKKP